MYAEDCCVSLIMWCVCLEWTDVVLSVFKCTGLSNQPEEFGNILLKILKD